LAQARQPKLWREAKASVAKAGVGLSVEVLKAVLAKAALAALGLPG
jgi:hypothetical protein